MKNIDEYTSQELYALAKRKAEEEHFDKIPKELEVIDWEPLLSHSQLLMEDIANGNWQEESAQHLYETVMTTIYGDKVFDWINKTI